MGLCLAALVIMLKNTQDNDYGAVSYADLTPFKRVLKRVVTYVILTAGTVSVELMYLAYHRDQAMSWSKECYVFDSFCRRATASIGITFGVVACYVVLSLLSSYWLFSTYEAPLPIVGNNGLKIPAFPR